ncbi:PepSY-associated TM helix domain-containing protein [Hylemonella gracilis]|nr:PepSY-associated TM helix domain-containing protein [Hylemonella gracilis]
MLTRMRPALVLAHRWLGLVTAGFLLLAAVTGSLLVWNDELDAAINPGMFRVQEVDQPPLDTLLLRDRVLARYPHAQISYVPLERNSGWPVRFRLQPARDDTSGRLAVLENDEIFVHPWTGDILGERRWGDITQGVVNLMPFVYRLHYSLALDTVGVYLLGIVALLWSVDCLIGAWLTLPAAPRTVAKAGGAAAWLRRWWAAWRVRWSAGGYKRHFDLHRAGGLWAWAALFVLAWSSVAFNLPQVYKPVMYTLFAHQDEAALGRVRSQPSALPTLSWAQARDIGRVHMADYARRAGFSILAEGAIAYHPRQAAYRYDVRSTLDVREHGSKTRVLFDARTGALLMASQPTGAYAGDTIRMWLTSLHMAAVGGLPMRLFVSFMGLVVAVLCVTGVVIWNRKRKGRKAGLAGKN